MWGQLLGYFYLLFRCWGKTLQCTTLTKMSGFSAERWIEAFQAVNTPFKIDINIISEKQKAVKAFLW